MCTLVKLALFLTSCELFGTCGNEVSHVINSWYSTFIQIYSTWGKKLECRVALL